MPAYFSYPIPLMFPVVGQVGYCFEFYSVDDSGTIKPGGWYDWTTGAQVLTWDVSKTLRPIYRRSTDSTSPDSKIAMMAIPQKVLAYSNVVALVYSVADNDKRDLLTTYDRATLLRIVGG